MAKFVLVAAMSKHEDIERWQRWLKHAHKYAQEKKKASSWFNLGLREELRRKVETACKSGEAELWIKAHKQVLMKAKLLEARFAPVRQPEEWKEFAIFEVDPKRAITWLLFDDIQPANEPYEPSRFGLRELQKPRQRAFGVLVSGQLPNFKQLAGYFRAHGFHFTGEQFAAFYAALKTKGFVILSGLSGTGKTKLAQLFAELLCPKCNGSQQEQQSKPECTHLFLSVRPDWRDGKALLGYYNPLTNRYKSTPLVRFLIGTVNIDETTYMFSPKVLDRAFTLEFRDVDFSDYSPTAVNYDAARKIAEQIRDAILNDLRNGGKFCGVTKREVNDALNAFQKHREKLVSLGKALQPYDLHFGYRVVDEIALFVRNATNLPESIGKLDDDTALDYAVLMKVLPKFHGPRQKLERPLREVLSWAAKENAQVPKWVKTPNETVPLDAIVQSLRNWESLKQATGDQKQRSGAEPKSSEWERQSEGEQGAPPSNQQQGEKRQNDAVSPKHFRYPRIAKKALQMLRQLYETGFASFAG